MKYCLIILILIAGPFVEINAQKIIIKNENGDCENAIPIDISKTIIADNPKSFGRIKEINSPKGDKYYFEKEHFTVWYKFSVAKTGILDFVITPEIPTDDYDFILFECASGKCCDSIINKTLKPIRTNISRVKYDEGGKTGLNERGEKKFVHEGKGNPYSIPVKIIAGYTYYLVLDNVYGGSGGHRINFKQSVDKPKKLDGPPNMLNITVIDKQTKEMINAHILLLHYNKDFDEDTVLNQQNSSVFLAVKADDYYEIIVSKDNYLLSKQSFTVGESDSLINKVVELQSVEVGTTFNLDNVYFKGGSASFVGNSQQALRKLYILMKTNKNLEIEIQGHVNLPNYSIHRKPEGYYNQLSIDRAKAVYDYLVRRGIDKSRLDYQGYGYSQMIYPNARTTAEMQKNRRVEIKIIKN